MPKKEKLLKNKEVAVSKEEFRADVIDVIYEVISAEEIAAILKTRGYEDDVYGKTEVISDVKGVVEITCKNQKVVIK